MNVAQIATTNYMQTEYKNVADNIAVTLPINNENKSEDKSTMSDKQRELLTGYMGYQSKVDQIDIYLRGSTNGEVGYDGALPSVQTFNDMQNKMKISDVYA
jgi:hypothetical protein